MLHSPLSHILYVGGCKGLLMLLFYFSANIRVIYWVNPRVCVTRAFFFGAWLCKLIYSWTWITLD